MKKKRKKFTRNEIIFLFIPFSNEIHEVKKRPTLHHCLACLAANVVRHANCEMKNIYSTKYFFLLLHVFLFLSLFLIFSFSIQAFNDFVGVRHTPIHSHTFIHSNCTVRLGTTHVAV